VFNAFNPLFLAYVAVFSAGIYGLVLVVGALRGCRRRRQPRARRPRRGLAWFPIACGVVTATVRLLPLIAALIGAGRGVARHIHHDGQRRP
jgi:hypothetical protein